MLKKSSRLLTRQVSLVVEKGKIAHSPLFTIRFLSGQSRTRLSVVVAKKKEKKAVGRNLGRRRVYEALALFMPKIKIGTHAVIFLKEQALGADFQEMKMDLAALLKKSSMI